MSLDIEQIRKQFPILGRKVNGKPLIYLDNAATTQKPQIVLDAIQTYYQNYNSNIHRGAHYLASLATEKYETARETVRDFINAESTREINFVRGTTEAINLVAQSYGNDFIKREDEILISALEHHSNIVPWQMLCERKGCILKVIPVLDTGEIDMGGFRKLLSHKTKLVAIAYVSNALGTVNPVGEIIKEAHAHNAIILVDAAQAAPHLWIDVKKLNADFLAFSAHKIYGPTGIGVLYGKEELLNKMSPWQGGGEMISEVTFEKTTYNTLPYKFEAGTPNIEGTIALGEALNWIRNTGQNNIEAHESNLLQYCSNKMKTIDGIRLIGTADKKVGVISFLLGEAHPFDVGVLLDQMGIAIRTGHHCCQPLMKTFGIQGTCRASFAAYNTKEEIDAFIESLQKAQKMLA